MSNFIYKSYFWSVGTTSFRTSEFNLKIEKQLSLIEKFRELNKNKSWNKSLQEEYYKFLKKENFVKKDANRPDKDARQKTSGLVNIGLIDNERNITKSGYALLEITKNNKFQSENIFEIPNDSYIYFKQMLKTYNKIENNIVRPFIVFLYAVSKLGYLSKEEFTYLLPLCINNDTTIKIINDIKKLRENEISIDDIIISTFMKMPNYQETIKYFTQNEINEEVICKIGMNRKSSGYEKAYYNFFNMLKSVALNKEYKNIIALFNETKNISGHSSTLWKKYLFNKNSEKSILNLKEKALNNVAIFNVQNEEELKNVFFKILHLFKAKSTLSDYFDLNRRYFKITDIVIFEDNKVELDIIPKCYFNSISDKLFEIAFIKEKYLNDNIEIYEIADFLKIDENKLYSDISKMLGQNIKNKKDAKVIITNEKYNRFNKLIDECFNKDIIIDLLNKFEKRDDKNIKKMVTDNADIPTIFEYILAIAWYLVSEKKGNILEYINLSLEADLLPKSHASGGSADIEYKYEKSSHYPKHTVLIEATLSESTNQRRMEIEPVSRHLGDYLLAKKDENAYTLFISTYLHRNVISDFRNRKTYIHYSNDLSDSVNGIKIISLSTKELKTILKKSIKYNTLYTIFENAYKSDTEIHNWYLKEIEDKL